MATTDNYSFKKHDFGYPVRDDELGDNLVLIDAAIKAREDETDAAEALADGKVIVGNGSGIATDVVMSGDVTIVNSGTTTIGANKVTISKLDAALLKGINTFAMSFETDEQTTTKIYFPMKVTINKIRSIVMKALTATNAGTITCANSVGASSNGVVTIAASAALNEKDSASPTTNMVVAAGSYYQLTTAKANTGGKVLVTLEYTRTA
jgi:hypothetical protein